jgi:PmbA protein
MRRDALLSYPIVMPRPALPDVRATRPSTKSPSMTAPARAAVASLGRSAEHPFPVDTAVLERVAAAILAAANSGGATAAETEVSQAVGQSVTVRQGEVETIAYNRDKGITVTVYVGQRRGQSSTADFGDASIRAAVDKALAIARFTAEDPCAGLADPSRLARNWPDLDLYHPWALSVDDAIELGREAERAALAVDTRLVNSEGANVSRGESEFVYANSNGFCGGWRGSRHHIDCSVIGEDGGSMQRDYWYSASRVPGELLPAADVGRIAGERTARRLNARKLGTLECPVLFEAPEAADLIGSFVHAASGGSLYRRASFLLDALGTGVFSTNVSIREEPHLPRARGSAPFDGEGVATAPRDVVRNGVLEGYFLGSYSARKLGLASTANAGGAHTLVVSHGDEDFAAMVRRMGRGLLVTEQLGQGVNLVTGDYSRGAAGFWVEGGEIAYPVEEITIAGNLKDVFRDIVAIGSDVDRRGSRHVGSILVGRMTVAGH